MSISDAVLQALHEIAAGDANAFAVIIEEYRSMVFSIVRIHVPREQVEGVAHDAFIRAYRSLPQLRDPQALTAWLRAIATRQCYDFLRQKYRNRERAISNLGAQDRDQLAAALGEEAGRQFNEMQNDAHAKRVLDWALSKLGPQEQMVLTLVHLEGASVAEAARILGWSVAKVKVQAFRSRLKLRKLLEKLDEREQS